MTLLKAWNFLKKGNVNKGLAVALLFCSFEAFGQVRTGITAYISKPGVVKMTKEEFIKVDSIAVSLNGATIINYGVTIAGLKNGTFYYWHVIGNKMSKDVKNLLVDNCNCSVVFDEIRVLDKKDTSMVSPIIVQIQ